MEQRHYLQADSSLSRNHLPSTESETVLLHLKWPPSYEAPHNIHALFHGVTHIRHGMISIFNWVFRFMYFILIFILTLLLSRRTGEAWETSNKALLFRVIG
jgi:hypothetical protein